MSRRPRRRFSDVQKTKAVLSHVQDGVPVSQVCENLGIHPNQYYDWQKQAFSSLPHVFSRDAIRQERSHRREVDNLKAKLSQKDEVIAELLTEHIALKKKTGVKNSKYNGCLRLLGIRSLISSIIGSNAADCEITGFAGHSV